MTEAMGEAFGSKPENLAAVIGPSICQDCYEVSEEVAEQFTQFPGAVKAGKQPGKYQLNLWEANRQILRKAGLLEEHIAVAGICTCCNSDLLFSHRATGGKRGLLGAFLALG